MRDSRIGTYGVCALVLSILIRAGALATIGEPGLVAGALIAAHGAARATLPVFMFLVPPARADGLASMPAGRRANRPQPRPCWAFSFWCAASVSLLR